jgi:hypothetical protein
VQADATKQAAAALTATANAPTSTATSQPPTSTPTPTASPTPTWTPAPTVTPTATPAIVFASGTIDVPQTWTFDLETGLIGSDEGTDLWFEADTATARYITPFASGVAIALVTTSADGPAVCAAAPLSTARIDISTLTTGSLVCVRTTEGRYAQLRVLEPVGPSPGTLKISYTTWEP